MRQEVGLKETQNLIKEILRDIDRVCRANDIDYSVAYGTLIGAVRHQGFIPWDDDVDLLMTAENYFKFIQVKDQLNPRYKLVSVETSDTFAEPIPKVIDTETELIETGHRFLESLGAYVDIFIFSYVSEKPLVRKLDVVHEVIRQKLWGIPVYHPKTSLKIEDKIRTKTAQLGMARKMSEIMSSTYYRKKTKRINKLNITDGDFVDYSFPSDVIETCDMQFEDLTVRGFKHYDYILTKQYGNYMQLPPEEQRVSNHSNKIYMK